MTKKIAAVLILCLVSLGFAGFWFFGCATTVDSNGTTTSTALGTSTTAATTTTVAHGISGTITNYQGDSDELTIAIMENSPVGDDNLITSGVYAVSGSQAAYSFNVDEAGNYYVVAQDCSFSEYLQIGGWVGAYGWTGTASLGVGAGDMPDAANDAYLANATSIEVSSMATANFTMHEIINAPASPATTYTVTGTAPAGTAGYYVICCDGVDPRNEYVSILVSAEVQGNLSFSLTNVVGSPETISASIWSTWPTDTVVNNLEYMYDYADDGNSGSAGDMFYISEDTILDPSKWVIYD